MDTGKMIEILKGMGMVCTDIGMWRFPLGSPHYESGICLSIVPSSWSSSQMIIFQDTEADESTMNSILDILCERTGLPKTHRRS